MKEYFLAFDLGEIFKASMVLFAVIDIIGSVPLILKIKEQSGDIHEVRTSFVSLGIMIGFLILGESILKLFGVDIGSFAVAGSFILFAMSFEMILGVKLFRDSVSGKTASVVPLAFPIIAGAGTMTTLVTLRAEYQNINIIVAIILNVAIVYAVLRLTNPIERLLGPGGIAILKKVFGIVILAIAVRLFTTNIAKIISASV
jgi:multiple antibiotic resistance protein